MPRYTIGVVALLLAGFVFLQLFFGRGTFPFELPQGISLVEWERESGLDVYEMRIKLKGDSVDLLRTFGEAMLVETDGGKRAPVVIVESSEFSKDMVPYLRKHWFDLDKVRNNIVMNFDLEIRGSSGAQVVIDVDRKFLYFTEVK